MVRFLKVKELEERRRVLVMRSEIYRQTLRLEVAALKFSAMELKHRFGLLRTVRRYFGMAASLAGLFHQRRGAESGKGFFSRLFTGVKFAAGLMPFFKKFGGSSARDEESEAAADHR